MPAYLYVIGPVNGPFKIGFANDVQKRLSALQTSTHVELNLHASIAVDDPRKAESAIHERLDKYLIRGEWFRCSKSEAISIIESTFGKVIEANPSDREAENYSFLLSRFDALAPVNREYFAKLYGISDASAAALAKHRTAEIMIGRI
jgi:hypothetical protein